MDLDGQAGICGPSNFLPWAPHEVMTVECPSKRIRRFALCDQLLDPRQETGNAAIQRGERATGFAQCKFERVKFLVTPCRAEPSDVSSGIRPVKGDISRRTFALHRNSPQRESCHVAIRCQRGRAGGLRGCVTSLDEAGNLGEAGGGIADHFNAGRV